MQLQSMPSMKLLVYLSVRVPILLAATVNVRPTAPVGGAPFNVASQLPAIPSVNTDSSDSVMQVNRISDGAYGMTTETASANVCNMGDQADKYKCLHAPGRGCMWASVETRDPYKYVQSSNAYCLPCTLDDEEIPCWNIGAFVDGKQVTDCQMSCDHQKRIVQPQYACSSAASSMSQSQCFSRGDLSGSKCMYTVYEIEGGEGGTRGSCAPCELEGSGSWGCARVGDVGPFAGSRVQSCMSQCDVLCTGPPNCPPTVAPPPPLPPPAPGVGDSSGPADRMVNVPASGPFVAPTVNPAMVIQAARDAALKAGFAVAQTSPPPKIYWPVVYYRSPEDLVYTTGPPPMEGPEPPPTFFQSMLAPRKFESSRQKRTRFLAPLVRGLEGPANPQ